MAVATQREFGLFIDGESVEPASGEIRDLPRAASGEARRAAHGWARRCRPRRRRRSPGGARGPWAKTPPTERSRLLHALADAIHENRKELGELETRNVGKALSSSKAEVATAAENFRFFASAITSIAGRSHPVGGSILYYALKEPVGVCGQIVPWNFPILMAAWKLSPAPRGRLHRRPEARSRHAAHRAPRRRARERGRISARRGQRRARRRPDHRLTSGLAPGCRQGRLHGLDPDRRRDHAPLLGLHQAPTLELGGKSPNLVFADADLDDAIPSAVYSIYYSAGQSYEARSTSSSSSRSTTTSSRASPRPPSDSGSAIRSSLTRRWAR